VEIVVQPLQSGYSRRATYRFYPIDRLKAAAAARVRPALLLVQTQLRQLKSLIWRQPRVGLASVWAIFFEKSKSNQGT
jgi:hypothetical protein